MVACSPEAINTEIVKQTPDIKPLEKGVLTNFPAQDSELVLGPTSYTRTFFYDLTLSKTKRPRGV